MIPSHPNNTVHSHTSTRINEGGNTVFVIMAATVVDLAATTADVAAALLL